MLFGIHVADMGCAAYFSGEIDAQAMRAIGRAIGQEPVRLDTADDWDADYRLNKHAPTLIDGWSVAGVDLCGLNPGGMERRLANLERVSLAGEGLTTGKHRGRNRRKRRERRE